MSGAFLKLFVAVFWLIWLWFRVSDSGQLTFHVNNCLEEMTFVECVDFIGEWITKPTPTIPQYSRGMWVVDLPENAKVQQGNCTFQYANKNGDWIAFFDWQWAYFGTQATGGGTSDVIDGELTDLSIDNGRPADPHECFWLWYGSGSEMDCVFRTNDTICHPEQQQQQQPQKQSENNPNNRYNIHTNIV